MTPKDVLMRCLRKAAEELMGAACEVAAYADEDLREWGDAPSCSQAFQNFLGNALIALAGAERTLGTVEVQ